MDPKLLASIVVGFGVGSVVAGLSELQHLGREILGLYEPRTARLIIGAFVGLFVGGIVGWQLGGLQLGACLGFACVVTALMASLFAEYPVWLAYLAGGTVGGATASIFYGLFV